MSLRIRESCYTRLNEPSAQVLAESFPTKDSRRVRCILVSVLQQILDLRNEQTTRFVEFYES
jgi:hypothetical protein